MGSKHSLSAPTFVSNITLMGAASSNHKRSQGPSHQKPKGGSISSHQYYGTNINYVAQNKEQQYGNPVYQFCDVCGELDLLPNSRLIKDPFWGQIYCKRHQSDMTPKCCGCRRYKSRDQLCTIFSDGRIICPCCRSTSIMTIHELQPLIRDVHQFFESLNLKVRGGIPILLIDNNEMIKKSNKQKDLQYERILGVTIPFAARSVTVRSVTNYSQIGEKIQVLKETKHLPRGKVSGILLLFGLPKVTIGTILAHEMMHVWMCHQAWYRPSTLDRAAEEGICQVIAEMWVESFSVGDEFESKLREYEIGCIKCHCSPIYGDGYRMAKRAVERYGLQATLNHIAQTRRLPQ